MAKVRMALLPNVTDFMFPICHRMSARLRSLFPLQWADIYSIGIYSGKSVLDLKPYAKNPVLRPSEITDVPARYVADPFVVRKENRFYMFFEVWNLVTDNGQIGLAVSDDGLIWQYQKIVLKELFHLSYPYVFQWKNAYYMIPESSEAGSIRLYEANPFPVKWSYLTTLLRGYFVDASVVYYARKWWLFVGTNPSSKLCLYHAPELTGPWAEHPKNPIVVNDHSARPAGRLLILRNRVFRIAQDCHSEYGLKVRLFEISKLTELDYVENEIAESPILQGSGTGWNAKGMHHLDAQQLENGVWMATTDGRNMSLIPRAKKLEQIVCSLRSKLGIRRPKGQGKMM